MARRPDAAGHDQSRREFFRTFSHQAVQNAGAVAGAAAELRRTSISAARELFEVPGADQPGSAAAVAVAALPEASSVREDFRSAYRYTGSTLIVLDQRRLPDEVATFDCHSPNEIAAAMRAGAVAGGPVLGQLAAYGICLAAGQFAARVEAERGAAAREQVIRAAAGTLGAARPEVRALKAAVERMLDRFDTAANAGGSDADVHAALVNEADRITTEATDAHAALGRHWATLLAETVPDAADVGSGAGDEASGGGEDRGSAEGGGSAEGRGGRPISLLLHGEIGPLACGLVGMGTAALVALADMGRSVTAWVTECAPSAEGRALETELLALDVQCTRVPDTAVGWLLSRGMVDVVALRGDTVAGNGDAICLLGATGVARLAAVAGVPVHVLAPEASWLHAVRDASALDASRVPLHDLVPAELVSAYISERGVTRPPLTATSDQP